MKQKNADLNIKRVRDFLESWQRFHNIFKAAFAGDKDGNKKEEEFLLTKDLMSARFEDLMDSLGVRPSKRIIDGEPIYSLLGLDEFSAVSDETLRSIEGKWDTSFVILGRLLGRLERNKTRLANFSRFSVMVKKRKKKEMARRRAK